MIPANAFFVDGGPATTADNLNTFLQSVGTVADLRNFVGATGMQVSLQGTTAVADGGQGLFYWALGTFTDDGVNIIVPFSSFGGAWKRLPFVLPTVVSLFLGSSFTPTLSYTGSNAHTLIQAVVGNAAAPDTTEDAVGIFQKWTNGGPGTLTSYIDAALYASIFKGLGGTAAGSRASAIFSEAQDTVGGGFVEGVRSHGIIGGFVSGSAYGVIAVGAEVANGTHVGYLVGVEAEIDNNSVDANYPWNTGNSTANHFEACFLATSGGTKMPFAAFMLNPFTQTSQEFQVGFYVPPGQLNSPVAGSAFRSDQAGGVWGLDLVLANPSFGAIGIPNNKAIRGAKSDFTTTCILMYIATDNTLVLGDDANIPGIHIGGLHNTNVSFLGSAMWTANGGIATALTGVGPTGANTNVQEWFTVFNPAGIVRYIPAF